MSKRIKRPPGSPIMPSFTAQHYAELRLLLGSIMQQFLDGLDTSKVHFDRAQLPQFEQQANYYRTGLAVLRDILHQVALDQKRHEQRSRLGAKSTGTATGPRE